MRPIERTKSNYLFISLTEKMIEMAIFKFFYSVRMQIGFDVVEFCRKHRMFKVVKNTLFKQFTLYVLGGAVVVVIVSFR